MESNHQRAERQASEWLARRDSEAWSSDDQAALDDWLHQSSANAVAFIRLGAAWNRADRYKALGAGFSPRCVPTPQQLGSSPFFDERVSSSLESISVSGDSSVAATAYSNRIPRRSVLLTIAASLLVAIGIAHYVETSNSTLVTPVGGLASMPLRDGSRVILNTDSEVSVAVTDVERHVLLQRGEAYFEVAKDPTRPFVVDAGVRRIVAVGTQFAVRRDGANVLVTVTEGRVRLEDVGSRKEASAREGAFILDAGGVAHLSGEGVLVQSKPLAVVQDSLSWRAGFVVFRNVDLAEAIAEFNRYNDKKIAIEDPAVASIRLSGKFRTTNFDAFVRLLEDGYSIDATDRDGKLVLSERAD